MDDLLQEFLAETSETLAILDVELVKFEQNPNNADVLMNIFRLMHTIKGTCGFLGLSRLERVAHAGEDVLGMFRDGEIQVTAGAVSLILAAIDRIRDLLNAIGEDGREPDGDDGALILQLRAVASDPAMEVAAAAAPAAPVVDAAVPAAPVATAAAEAGTAFAETAVASPGHAPVAEAGLDDEMASSPAAEARSDARGDAGADSEAPRPAASAVATVAPQAAATGVVATVDADAEIAAADRQRQQAATQAIRVNVGVLEDLMTMVSELVLTRNNLLQMVRGHSDSEFAEPLQRLSLITTDLQEGVMKTRMQPVGNAWGKLPRIVRDLAVETGKKLDLQMIGAETELDRQVLELIQDPLTHMVRNSADHGIEMPAERLAGGKREVGTIRLRAFHEGGHIIIEVSDDGRGLNTERIRRKLLERGLVTATELGAMPDSQVHQTIFRAGFSTAEQVTNVSGRGVGMDVVRTNIEKIGGTIELKSVPGAGTTFTIRIPLTLAIVSALIIECCGERFALPQLSVRELVQVSPSRENSVEVIKGTPVMRLRNRLLPLISLHDLLKLKENTDITDGRYFVIVTHVGAHNFGLVVDQVFDTEEIVVKPVARVLRHIPFYSGNTILGDGSVIMILDPNGISAHLGQDSVSAKEETEAMATAADRSAEIILFRAGSETPKAVPMALVARLEDIEVAAVENSCGRDVIQYRGQLMPLLTIDGSTGWRERKRCPVLVFTNGEHTAGLIVDEILDIVRTPLDIDFSGETVGVVGAAVISGKSTEIVDVGFYLHQAFADWFGEDAERGTAAVDSRGRVLIIDDSPFYVETLRPQFDAEGLSVTSIFDSEGAFALRNKGVRPVLILCSLTLAGGNGFDVARAIRADAVWGQVPMIGIAGKVLPADVERGRECGFRDVVPKMQRRDLFAAVRAALAAQPSAMGRAA